MTKNTPAVTNNSLIAEKRLNGGMCTAGDRTESRALRQATVLSEPPRVRRLAAPRLLLGLLRDGAPLRNQVFEVLLVALVRRLSDRFLRVGDRLLVVARHRVRAGETHVDRPLIREALRVREEHLLRQLVVALDLLETRDLVEIDRRGVPHRDRLL